MRGSSPDPPSGDGGYVLWTLSSYESPSRRSHARQSVDDMRGDHRLDSSKEGMALPRL